MSRPDDLHAMTHPSLWPCWPILPIKNGRVPQAGGFPKFAVLVSTDISSSATPDDIRFIEGNMFTVTEKDLDNASKANVEQLIADGWVVD